MHEGGGRLCYSVDSCHSTVLNFLLEHCRRIIKMHKRHAVKTIVLSTRLHNMTIPFENGFNVKYLKLQNASGLSHLIVLSS